MLNRRGKAEVGAETAKDESRLRLGDYHFSPAACHLRAKIGY